MDIAQKSSLGKEMQTIVEVGPYRGLFGTMHSIIYEEGEKGPAADLVKGTGGAPALKAGNVGQESRRRKGQGFEGLWRGWRVGMWGLVGVWARGGVGSVLLGCWLGFWGPARGAGVGAKGGEF